MVPGKHEWARTNSKESFFLGVEARRLRSENSEIIARSSVGPGATRGAIIEEAWVVVEATGTRRPWFALCLRRQFAETHPSRSSLERLGTWKTRRPVWLVSLWKHDCHKALRNWMAQKVKIRIEAQVGLRLAWPHDLR